LCAQSPPLNDSLFHPPGLAWFWALNDACDDATMDRMIDRVCPGSRRGGHPASARWIAQALRRRRMVIACIERTVRRCARRHVPVWLYDEDP